MSRWDYDDLCVIEGCRGRVSGHTRLQRNTLLRRDRAKHRPGSRPCKGCHSGVVPWNQGSVYCAACIRRERAR